MTTTVRDARPPTAVIRILNPIMRNVLRTPLGRLVRPFALLEFEGRRSGRYYRVPVGWHEEDGVSMVFTPAPWRVNFAHGARTTVRHRGQVLEMTGTLVTDRTEVARALESLFTSGTRPRAVGLDVPTGHTLTAIDVATVDRALIRFRP
jgi:hypothetical protein